MKYNIKIHILDHSAYVVDRLNNQEQKLTHFNTSVCNTYFISQGIVTQNEIDEIMINILKNILSKKMVVKEKNGTFTKKNGKKVQRYRTRTIDFKKMLIAYHNRHFDSSKSVSPHFHFLFDESIRTGKDFMYLRQALRFEAKKHNIKFNFMEQKQITGLSKKQLNRIESLSWLLNQGHITRIKKYLSNNMKLYDTLNLLLSHYQNTQNISYFLKILSILNQRLKELDIDFMYKNTNLKESIYFFLDKSQKNMLTDLEKGRTVELSLSRVLDREIIKKAHNFESSVMDILSLKFNLNDIKPKQLLYQKNYDKKTLKNQNTNSFRKLIIQDLRNTLAYAKSEKDWKDILVKTGYGKVSINTTKTKIKRVKTGITVTTIKKTKVYIPFHAMRLDFGKITQIMMYNRKRNSVKENYNNNFDSYQKREKRQHEILTKYTVQIQLLLQIYSNSKDQYKTNKNELENLARKYTIHTSKMYHITTYQAAHTTIVDNNTSITLKRSKDSTASTISDMLDIAMLKGWDFANLRARGSPDLVIEVKKQIRERLELKRPSKILTIRA